MERDLVGRHQELGALSGWLDEALDGSTRVVLLVGEAGIGKSSLADALGVAARERGATTAWGRAVEDRGAPPFWPWRQVLEQLGAVAVLDAPPDADPEADRFARFEAVAAALEAQATGSGGLVVLLDDVHWADEPSLRLLAHLAGRLVRTPLLVVAALRSTVADHAPGVGALVEALRRLSVHRRLELGGLDAQAVAIILGVDEEGSEAARVAEVTKGNPLFVGELARHLAAGGPADAVPPSVREAIRARLAERSARCAEALEVAAVVGSIFRVPVVAEALGWSAADTLASLDEAAEAGLVEPGTDDGDLQFVHALVRDAVESTLGAVVRAETHHRVAEAMERLGKTGDDELIDLARHWEAAAVLGHAEVAAAWCDRAAEVADRRVAWEEAVRWYDRALALAPGDPPLDRVRRLSRSAAAGLHSGEITLAAERCVAAAELALAAGRPDLAAEAVLLTEGRGGPPLAALRSAAEQSLERLPVDDHALRARLLGLLSGIAFYLDPEALPALSEATVAERAQTSDPWAAVAAARARQMVVADPTGAPERLELATAIGAAGRQLRRPTIAVWEPIWRIDALVELGRLPEALAELDGLRRAVDEAAVPVARWHLLRIQALLAQQAGRFDEALAHAHDARDLFAAIEDPMAAHAMHLGVLLVVQLHTGAEREVALGLEEIADLAPAFLDDLPRLGPVVAWLGVGEHERAARHYDHLAPVATWDPPAFMQVPLVCIRMWAAVGLGRLDDVALLADRLLPHRGAQAVTAGGAPISNGPAAMWLGVGCRALGQLDDAAAHLGAARDWAEAAGARGFEVQAAVELAEVHLAAGRAGAARELAAGAGERAVGLGMAPWATRAGAIASTPAQVDAAGPLSPRELEVAGLVAEGCTNRQIAQRLYLSERTAQNHVQHILTKLGVANRTQIAAWVHGRPTSA